MPWLRPRSSMLWQCIIRSSLSLAMPSAEHRAMTMASLAAARSMLLMRLPASGGVDDGLAVGAVVDADARLDGLLVGGIQSQRHVVEVLLEQLHRPLHQLRAVALGGADVHIQVGGAGGDLLGGTLEDGALVVAVHGLADGGGDTVDALADGDEGLAGGVVALVGDLLVLQLVGAGDNDGRRGHDGLGGGGRPRRRPGPQRGAAAAADLST